ncbi:MAG: thioredoxin-disulfide reductase [Anaerococcus sp.]|uniref:thioredoxin-disulfide reductase n=1 Tax=Anaerococcus sp. TaxID=1872515 RepID=UPI00261A5EAC|nr:thioredoxin-disulfide reductase [Anaerococcus sp.]MCI5971768.1 thioredoxin-disulfide reductase [Anaerococcus sp.]MDD6918229.1 thioredoxin-disulfide reductase [Peptoniphilaceae bacterium]MDY2927839.1 thioredoxin-disulfide reductase [Anaerococcus sp.]
MYDIIIIGGGPAGLTAGLYAGRSKLKTLIIEKAVAGGQISGTAFVENYPGSIDEATGMGLSERMLEQAEEFCDIKYEDVKEVELEGKVKKIKTDGGEYEAKVVIISSGATHRKLDVPGEKEFANKGVSYCATCDGPFYTGLDIFVVGGGDSALEEATYLTKFGKSVTIIHRRDEFRASGVVVDKIKENPKIKLELDAVVKEIKGDKEAESLIIENTKTGEIKELKSDDNSPIGVFIFIGYIPQTEIFEGKIKMNHGYILTDEDMKTNIEGVFAVGDTREKKVRQMVTAAGDGCIAAVLANRYLEGSNW